MDRRVVCFALQQRRRTNRKRLISRSDFEKDGHRVSRQRHVQIDAGQDGASFVDGRTVQRAGIGLVSVADNETSVGQHVPATFVQILLLQTFTSPEDERQGTSGCCTIDGYILADFDVQVVGRAAVP